MTNMMQGVVNFGLGYSAVRGRGFKEPAAGKTGSSHDGWFAGYTSNLLCIVWVGYDDYSDLHLSGAQTAAPIWTEFMKKASALTQYSDMRGFSASLRAWSMCNSTSPPIVSQLLPVQKHTRPPSWPAPSRARPAIRPAGWAASFRICWDLGTNLFRLRPTVPRPITKARQVRTRRKRKKDFSAKLWVSLRKTNRRPNRPNQPDTTGQRSPLADDISPPGLAGRNEFPLDRVLGGLSCLACRICILSCLLLYFFVLGWNCLRCRAAARRSGTGHDRLLLRSIEPPPQEATAADA